MTNTQSDLPKTPTDFPKCGDFDIHIALDGRWYYQNSLIQRHALCQLFASVLSRKENGEYWLETPVEQGRISVEDLPFVITEMRLQEGFYHFKTNLDDWVSLGKDHQLIVTAHPDTGAPCPKIYIRDGLWARISRSVFYELADHAELSPSDVATTTPRPYGIYQGDQFFSLEACTL